jgi:D-sedoheptulose 7-phosphate isomerase
MDTTDVWKGALSEAQAVLARFAADGEQMEHCRAFTDVLARTLEGGGTLFTCGNGGSHCDALHFAEEWTGRYRKARRPVAALALGEAAHLTCVGNDFGFDQVFSRQVEALGRPGDLLVAISTSGEAANLLRATEAARAKGLQTVGLLGRGGGRLRDAVDLAIVVPGDTTDRIQELHIKVIHTAIESVERRLFPENYR